MKIAFLGDIALIGKYDTSTENNNTVFDRLKWVKSVLNECDYVVANLEAPFTNACTTHEAKSMPLKSAPFNVCVLKYLGIDAVSLANNHIYDYGYKGAEETIQTLSSEGIACFGIGNRPLYVEKDGNKVALHGFCCFTSNGWHYDVIPGKGRLHALTLSAAENFVMSSKKNGYYPIVVTHWGEENTHYPKSEHIRFARILHDKIACSIIGHHPHVVQGVIRENSGISAFSLGNFIFDDCHSDKNGLSVKQMDDNKKGLIIVLNVNNNEFLDYNIIPFVDDENGIRFDDLGMQAVSEFSQPLYESYGNEQYEELRRSEQKQAMIHRLGKRDTKWLVNHLNYSSIMSVVQRKVNQKNFTRISRKLSQSVCDEIKGKVVLYVGNFGMPKTNAAGKRVYANALLLSKMGYNVLLIGTELVAPGTCIKINESITYTSFPSYGKNKGQQYFWWLKPIIERNRQKIKLVIRYGSPGLAIFDRYLSKYAKDSQIPLVVDVVDWLSVDGGSLLFKTVKTVDTFLEKAIFNREADGIIPISRFLSRYYKKSIKRQLVIPPLVEKIEFNDFYNKTPQIVYAGSPFRNWERIKNVHKLKDRLDAALFALCCLEKQGVIFGMHVVGLSQDEYLTAFPDHTKIINESKQIHFYGRLSMEETQQILKKMDYSILLREKNRATMAGFPTKVVESMSLGVPVITTNTSDLQKYIKNGINGFFVDMNNFGVLNRQLGMIISNHDKNMRKMKEACAKSEYFLVQNYEERFSLFLNSVLGE